MPTKCDKKDCYIKNSLLLLIHVNKILYKEIRLMPSFVVIVLFPSDVFCLDFSLCLCLLVFCQVFYLLDMHRQSLPLHNILPN